MRKKGQDITLSATDLANHLGCQHLTALDVEAELGGEKPSIFTDPVLELLKKKGFEHEKAYAASLEAAGKRVVDCGREGGAKAEQLMRDGVDVITQAPLAGGGFRGIADFLVRVEVPSDLGAFSYEVIDTKLAQNTRAGTILQLSLYSELVGAIQGQPPEWMYVVKPGVDFPKEPYRLDDFGAYYRLVKARLVADVAARQAGGGAPTYPTPVEQCSICRWWKDCSDQRRADDHLSLVAGMSTMHTVEFERQGVSTLTQLGDADVALPAKPQRGNEATFDRLKEQARVQLEHRRTGEHVVEYLEVEIPAEPNEEDPAKQRWKLEQVQRRGFPRLPAPSSGDVFFDIEGARFVEDGGLEYLLGWCVRSADGELEYRGEWAFDRKDERRAFEVFLDEVMARLAADPGMHVYHFAPYEPAAMTRLAGRHGVREDDVDRLLRGRRFVDLYAVARQALRISTEGYGLKDLEPVFGFSRGVDLREASQALRRLEWALEVEGQDTIAPADRVTVEGYNREDCVATAELRDWLEVQRDGCPDARGLPRPPLLSGDPSDELVERKAEVQRVYDKLISPLPEDRASWSAELEAHWQLAQMLDYHRREMNCAHRNFFELRDREVDELFDDRKAVVGLRFLGEEPGGTAKCPVHRYAFPPQEAAVDPDDTLVEAGGARLGSVIDFDPVECTIDIKKSEAAANVHAHAVVVDERVKPWAKASSLLEFAKVAAMAGVDGPGPFRAGRDLLLRLPPRRVAGSGPLIGEHESILDSAVRVVNELDGGLLPIQGPPGSGKTYIGARMIVDLARQGRRIGVTAVSHKVVRNLLDEVHAAAEKAGVRVPLVQKVREADPAGVDHIEEITGSKNEEAEAAVVPGTIVGGTAWLWSRDGMASKLDYVFVDEAGQMAIADVLAVSRAARNVVLLGDPQQLEQPQQGSHPDGTEVAALVHVLGDEPVMPADKGLFFGETWRLHPSICEFTSELYYDGKLASVAGCEQQALCGPTRFAGAGLFTVPVEHTNNQSRSLEEVAAVVQVVGDLLSKGVTWIDREGHEQHLEREDILIVAPFNSQLAALREQLPGMRIGTVDKFQGQQAPVVIYSMTSSSTEDAPRGLGFLFSPNRFNVATSRAKCVCILVASPRLFEADCKTPEQMRWANGVCRYGERSTEVRL